MSGTVGSCIPKLNTSVLISTSLTKVANLLRVELLSAKLGSFIVSKFFMLVKALELIAKTQVVWRDIDPTNCNWY